MNNFVNVVVAAAVAATGALFAPTAQAAPKQQEVCYDITYVHEKRWSREVPGQDAVTHKEYRFSRENPGQEKVTGTEYKYKRTVKTPKYKTIYEWEKWVKGTKEKKGYHGRWIPDGNFDWMDYPDAGPTWDDKNGETGPHRASWVVGDVKYTSTEYKYVKTGKTKTEQDGFEYKTETTDFLREAPEGEGWVQVDSRPYTIKEYIAPFTEYKTKDGVTKDQDKADWFTEDSFDGWTQFGEPKLVTDSEAVPGYTEYYVAGGDHTRTLGESNWTTDTPEGWTFVDERKREVKNEIPCVNPPKRITKRFQVDTYSNPTTKLANKAASYDDDGRLKYGEDRPHYGHSRWQIVSVVGYDNWTKAQWITAVNKATTRAGVGNVTSTSHAGKVKKGQKLTVAWEIKKDSWPNKGKRGAQVFLARGLK